MRRRVVWLIAAIAGLCVVPAGLGMGGLLFLFSFIGGQEAAANNRILAAGVAGTSIVLGMPLAWQGWLGWRGRPSRPFHPPPAWPLVVGWGMLVGLGAALSRLSDLAGWLLPLLHIPTMMLPPIIVLCIVGRAMRGSGGAGRSVVAATGGGGLFSLGSAIFSEGVLGFTLALGVVFVVVMMPDGPERLKGLQQRLQDPAWLAETTNLAELLRSPAIALSLLGIFCIPIPLIEEFFKPLLGGVAGRWMTPNAARSFLWGVAGGAGFALGENLLNGALGGAAGWAGGAIARFGATAMHCFTTGLVGWGWGQLWATRRPWWLCGAYVAAVAIHGVWNAASIGAILLSAGSVGAVQDGATLTWGALGTFVLVGLLCLLTGLFIAVMFIAGRTLAPHSPLSDSQALIPDAYPSLHPADDPLLVIAPQVDQRGQAGDEEEEQHQ